MYFVVVRVPCFNGIRNQYKQMSFVKWWINFYLLQRVHLDIQVGEHAVDYAHVAQKEKLSELQLRVRQLLDQVEQITKEQNYQRVSRLHLWTLLGNELTHKA